MKKSLILTSVLALAACGGGSGGGNSAVAPGMTDFERVAASNAKITGMVSRIKDGDSYSNLSRGATTHRAASVGNNITGTVYLDDVLFESSDKEYGDINEDFQMRFHVNANGKIDGIYAVDDGEEGLVDRVGDENKFSMQDDEGEVTFSVALLGREKNLKYSDFGFLTIDGVEYGESENNITHFVMPIAGGYKTKNITDTMNADDLTNDVVFNGIAVAGVGEPDTTVSGERLTLRDNNATLTFDKESGNEILSANFVGYTDSETGIKYNDWYNVEATKYADGDAKIAFSTPSGRIIPTGFEATDSGKVQNNSAEHQLSIGFNYYGDSANNPNEATGIIHYQCEGCQPLLMGFGGKAE